MNRATVARPIGVRGVGLHTGHPASVELRPGAPGTGRVFVSARGDRVPATLSSVVGSDRATVLGGPRWRVATVEHLLAAAYALCIDDLEVAVSGGELPVLDGSATGWVAAFDEAGRAESDVAAQIFTVAQEARVERGEAHATLAPPSPGSPRGLTLDLEIAFAAPAIGRQVWRQPLTEAAFRQQLATARTFALEAEVEALRRRGLIAGGSLDNALVFGADGPLNPGGLRAADEPVRHKALDLIGDLALLGVRLAGHVRAVRPGHALTHALLRSVALRPIPAEPR